MRRFSSQAPSSDVFESLERRRLLTTASVDAAHVLNIAGTDGADVIVVNRLSNGQVSVSGVTTRFRPGSGAGQFNRINISAGKGNDSVTINGNVQYTSATISGAAGNDTLTGGRGSDTLGGGSDNDTVDGAGGADLLSGDLGFDTANYSNRTENLTITLDNAANDGANGGAEKDNVQTEEVIAGAGNDSMTGSGGDDFLAGGAGNDVIRGMGGNDNVVGSIGADQLFGNNGNDFLQAKNQDRDTVNGGSNTDGTSDFDLASVDTIDQPGIGTAADEGNVIEVEQFVTDDELSGQSTLLPLAERLKDLSTSSLQYVRGQPNTDGVVAFGSKDFVNTIVFDKVKVNGKQTLAADLNGVRLFYDQATTKQFVITLGRGADLVRAGDFVKVPLLVRAGDGNDTVVGGGWSDIIFGEAGDDRLSGGARADVLVGGKGIDNLFGNDGRDILIGGDDADNLFAQHAQDILIGGVTSCDDDPVALAFLSAEWTSKDSYATRIDHLRNGGGLNEKFVLSTGPDRTVFADKGGNILNGGPDRDWFFHLATDKIKHAAKNEVIEKI